MTSDTRLFLVVPSAFGLTASIVAYGGSYVGMSMDSLSFWAIMLHIGAIFLIVPMYLANLSGIKDRTFSWKVFAQEMPAGSSLVSSYWVSFPPSTLFCS
jgi:hypothetical protein